VATVGNMAAGDPGNTDDLDDAGIVAAMAAGPAESWRRLFAAADALREGAHASLCFPSSPEGVLVFPHHVYSDTVEEIERLLYDLHVIIVSFDWPAWAAAKRCPPGDEIASAPVAYAARLTTVIVRGERFCDGTLAVAISDGTLSAILARLRRWFEEELPAAASSSPPTG
jgi:hypothetical protein